MTQTPALQPRQTTVVETVVSMGTAVPTTTIVISAITTHPLTTLFTPPSSCFAPTYTVPPASITSDFAYLTEYYDTISVELGIYAAATRAARLECFPSFYPAESNDVHTENYSYVTTIRGLPSTISFATTYGSQLSIHPTFYSPGLCPSGYTTVATEVRPNITSATCCPTASGSMTETDGTCYASPTTPLPITVVSGSQTSTMSVNAVFESPIYVAYEASDLPVLIAAGLATGSLSTSSPTLASVSSTGTSSNSASTNTSGLSIGAQAGIGVGVSLGILILASAIARTCIRRRKKQRVLHNQEPMREIDQKISRYDQDPSRYELQQD